MRSLQRAFKYTKFAVFDISHSISMSTSQISPSVILLSPFVGYPKEQLWRVEQHNIQTKFHPNPSSSIDGADGRTDTTSPQYSLAMNLYKERIITGNRESSFKKSTQKSREMQEIEKPNSGRILTAPQYTYYFDWQQYNRSKYSLVCKIKPNLKERIRKIRVHYWSTPCNFRSIVTGILFLAG